MKWNKSSTMRNLVSFLLWTWCCSFFSSTFGVLGKVAVETETETIEDVNAKMNRLMEKNLRRRKKRGIIRKREVSLASVLFPRVAPVNYPFNEEVTMYVDLVTSRQSNVPFEYHKLPVCPPMTTGKRKKNLGEKLKGHGESRPAPYTLTVGEDLGCQSLCQVDLTAKKVRQLVKLTKQRYRINLSLDSLPVYVQQHNDLKLITLGYPVGAGLQRDEDKNFFLHNHLKFTIRYNVVPDNEGVRIVGFQVKPISIAHDTTTETPPTCTPDSKNLVNRMESLVELIMPENGDDLKVIYSYEVKWELSDLVWSDRWDIYISACVDENTLHHARVINSLAVFVGLLFTAAITFVRMLRKDLQSFVAFDEDDESDLQGWKLLHADVFRPPSNHPLALTVLIGNGAQILFIFLASIALMYLRIINPMKKGQALGCMFMLYIVSGSICGYVSARLFKFFGGSNWQMSTIWSAAALPGFLMTLFLILNIFLAAAGAATSVSIWTILLIFILWTFMSIPLVFLGSYLGFKAEKIAVPTKTNQIARVVPEQHPVSDSYWGSLFVGMIAFSTITVETYMVMSAIWLREFYYAVGYLCFVAIIFGLSCAFLSTIACYLRMTNENHRWWWYAFTDTAFCGVWLIIYSAWFVAHQVKYTGGLPFVVYWTYMVMVSALLSLFAGAAGFIPTFFFVRKIFSMGKVD